MNHQGVESIETPAPTATAPRRHGFARLILRVVGIALAALGWYLSMSLLQVTGGAAPQGLLAALCHADAPAGGEGGAFDCNSVLRSRYAFVRSDRPGPAGGEDPGTPWAILGASYFGLLTLWFLFVGPANRRGWPWHALLILILACGASASFYLLRVMAFELHQWCAGCLAVHAINAALLIVAAASFPWRSETRLAGASATAPGAAGHPGWPLALATLAAGLMFWQWQVTGARALVLASNCRVVSERFRDLMQDAEYARWQFARQPVQARVAALAAQEPPAGEAAARHTVVAFIDFQCPTCAEAHRMLTELAQQHAGRLRVILRAFPLDAACNPFVKFTQRPHSCRAARAAEAVRSLAGEAAFGRMCEQLYEHRTRLATADLAALAGQAGVARADFERALDSPETTERLKTDIALAHEAGVNATPAIFLDGRRLEFWQSPKTWEALLAP